MDQSKRRFMKLLPLAAVAGIGVIKTADVEGKVIEVSPTKQYVFKVSTDMNLTQADVDRIQATLKERGFPTMLVVSGDVELFEIG